MWFIILHNFYMFRHFYVLGLYLYNYYFDFFANVGEFLGCFGIFCRNFYIFFRVLGGNSDFLFFCIIFFPSMCLKIFWSFSASEAHWFIFLWLIFSEYSFLKMFKWVKKNEKSYDFFLENKENKISPNET